MSEGSTDAKSSPVPPKPPTGLIIWQSHRIESDHPLEEVAMRAADNAQRAAANFRERL